MQLLFVINVVWMKVKMKNGFISSFLWHFKINENVGFATWDVVHRPLDTTWHLIQLQM